MSVEQGDTIAAHMKPGDSRDAFYALRGTGMRPMEGFSMRWEFWNRDLLYYQNPRGKTRASLRALPMLGQSTEVLARRHREQGSPAKGWAFPSRSKAGHICSIRHSTA